MTKKLLDVIETVASEKEATVELVTLKEIVYDLNLDYDKKSKAIRQALRSKKDELEALKNHIKKTRYEFDVNEAKEIQAFLKERFINKKDKEKAKSEKKEASKKATKATKKKSTVKKDDVKATTKKKATKKTTKKATKKVSE